MRKYKVRGFVKGVVVVLMGGIIWAFLGIVPWGIFMILNVIYDLFPGVFSKICRFILHPIPDKLKSFKSRNSYYDPEFDMWFSNHPFEVRGRTAPPPPPRRNCNVVKQEEPKYKMSKHKFE